MNKIVQKKSLENKLLTMLSEGDVSGVIEGLSEKVKSGQLNSGVLFLVDTG